MTIRQVGNDVAIQSFQLSAGLTEVGAISDVAALLGREKAIQGGLRGTSGYLFAEYDIQMSCDGKMWDLASQVSLSGTVVSANDYVDSEVVVFDHPNYPVPYWRAVLTNISGTGAMLVLAGSLMSE